VRPDVGEVIEGVRAILAEVIAPAVGSPYARSQLDNVLVALDAVGQQWADVLPALIVESDELERLLGMAADDLAGCESPLASQITVVLSQRPVIQPYPSFHAFAAHHERLRTCWWT
jgi:hypothetical protein